MISDSTIKPRQTRPTETVREGVEFLCAKKL